jgi:hypothetical protein
MHTINGIIHPKKSIYSWWSELSEQWTAIHRRYARVTADDAAYWYTERTNVGVLAQAAWACGLVALEEYQAKKARGTENEDPHSGRCDLWLANGKQGHFIEAKQRYLHLRSTKMTDIINECLERAHTDAVATRESEGDHGIGLAFFPIYIPVSSIEPEELSGELSSLPEKFGESEAELIAWCFPQETRYLKGQGEKNYVPGLVMAGKSI